MGEFPVFEEPPKKKKRMRVVAEITTDGIYTLIHKRLKYLRLAAGLSAEQLAEASGIHLSTVTRLERGKFYPRLDSLHKLSLALGCQLEVRITPLGPPKRVDYRKLNRAGRVVPVPKEKTLAEVQALVESLEQIVPIRGYRRTGLPRHKGTFSKSETTPETGEPQNE